MRKSVKIYDCSVIELPTIKNRAGNISIAEDTKTIPFDVKRVFYLYDIPAGEERGAHSHKECHQFIIAASGSFDVLLDDGMHKKIVNLNRPYYGIHIPPGIWAHELNFSAGAICLVLTSLEYDASDYIRDYDTFIKNKSAEIN